MAVTSEIPRRMGRVDPTINLFDTFATHGVIHLNGNSLGPARASLVASLRQLVAEDWTPHQVNAWFERGWLELPRTVGDQIGTLVGAAPGQVLVPGETTSTTLFNVLVAALRLRVDRPVLLVEAEAFPTDRYIAASVTRLLGRRLVIRPRRDIDDVLRRGGAEVAAVLAAPVDFRTAERRDIRATTALCHDAGAATVWDLSHAAGVLPTELDAHGVDFAVGCGYKYLGGGPGAPAFVYVAHRLQDVVDFPLTGWHGHATPFEMAPDFVAAAGIDRARTGTPPVLSIAALHHALEPLVAVGIEALHRRAVALGEVFLGCLGELSPSLRQRLASPEDPYGRGAHVALRVDGAQEVERRLADRGVLIDSRADLIRVAFAPLYVKSEGVRHAAGELVDVVREVEEGR